MNYGPRTRSQDNSSPEMTTSYSGFTVIDGVTTQISGNRPSYVPRIETVQMTDIVVPDFHKRCANGEIINSPMTQVKCVATENAPVLTIDNYIYVDGDPDRVDRMYSVGTIPAHSWIGQGDRQASIPTINIDDLVALATNQAWSNIDLSEAAALATIGEGRETIRSIISILKRVMKIMRSVRRLDAKALAGELKPKELADRYMELRYAIRPLICDAVQITNAFKAKAPVTDRLTFRGKAYKSSTNTLTTKPFDNYNDEFTLTVVSTAKREVEVRVGVLTQVEDFSKLNVWGFDQPIETMWELTPFSFILDWFFNIGQTIAAWTPEPGLKVLTSWSVVTDKVTTTTVGTLTSGTGRDLFEPHRSMSPMLMTSETITKTRTPNTHRAILPRFNLRLDALKLLDLGIILKNLRK